MILKNTLSNISHLKKKQHSPLKTSKQTAAQKIGQQAEQAAHDYLCNRGLTGVQRNFSCLCGEIDLIMNDKGTLVFIEVRFRKTTYFGSAASTVTYSKQRKLQKTAYYFLQRYKLMPSCRFDVVEVSYANASEVNRFCVHWIPNAFLSTE